MSEAKYEPIRCSYYYACRYLVANGPSTANMVGAVVWKGKERGKTTSMGGGGDYAAQMLLGRMKKAGLVRHAPSEGSTRWEVTALGRAEAAQPMSKLAAHLRKLVTDCRQCRQGFCCGQCLCCLSEDKLRKMVQEAQAEAVPAASRGLLSGRPGMTPPVKVSAPPNRQVPHLKSKRRAQ